MNYIPDLTERFPEGFGGVDMTPSFFGEPVDWSRAYGYEPSYEELAEDGEYKNKEEIEEQQEQRMFEVGQSYRQVGFYGGVTYYTVKEIDRFNERILLAEHWVDVDGEGERESEWHKLVTENGTEKALEWTSKEFGDIWIYA